MAEGLLVQGQPGLHTEILSQKQKTKENKKTLRLREVK
jgi:hypothetical protein